MPDGTGLLSVVVTYCIYLYMYMYIYIYMCIVCLCVCSYIFQFKDFRWRWAHSILTAGVAGIRNRCQSPLTNSLTHKRLEDALGSGVQHSEYKKSLFLSHTAEPSQSRAHTRNEVTEGF